MKEKITNFSQNIVGKSKPIFSSLFQHKKLLLRVFIIIYFISFILLTPFIMIVLKPLIFDSMISREENDSSLVKDLESIKMAIMFGIIGACLQGILSVLAFQPEKNFQKSYLVYYLGNPFLGAILAVITYMVLRLGLIIGTTLGETTFINIYFIVFISILVGAFAYPILTKINSIFDSLFSVSIDEKRNNTLPTTNSFMNASNVILVGLSMIVIIPLLFLFLSQKMVIEEFSSFFNWYGNCSANGTICYPSESLFYPWVFLALMISIIPIILSMMFFYRFKSSIINLLLKLKKDEKNTQNYIAVFGLVSPIIVYVATLILPFIVTIPLIDYQVESYNNDNKLKISLSNVGMVSAKNVIVSINANKTDVEFNNFTTEPLLSKSIDNLTSQTGNAFFKIDVIPPTSSTIIKADLKNLDNTTKITTSIRSDVWVAYHNLIPILVFYPSVLIGLSLLLIRMIKPIFKTII